MPMHLLKSWIRRTDGNAIYQSYAEQSDISPERKGANPPRDCDAVRLEPGESQADLCEGQKGKRGEQVMGYFRNECMVIHSLSKEESDRAIHEAIRIFNSKNEYGVDYSTLISPVIPSLVNHTFTFVIGVDGSKEGWRESDKANEARQEFIQWLKKYNNSYDWALILLGGDDSEYQILDSPS